VKTATHRTRIGTLCRCVWPTRRIVRRYYTPQFRDRQLGGAQVPFEWLVVGKSDVITRNPARWLTPNRRTRGDALTVMCVESLWMSWRPLSNRGPSEIAELEAFAEWLKT
jgi:hypothetical protein